MQTVLPMWTDASSIAFCTEKTFGNYRDNLTFVGIKCAIAFDLHQNWSIAQPLHFQTGPFGCWPQYFAASVTVCLSAMVNSCQDGNRGLRMNSILVIIS